MKKQIISILACLTLLIAACGGADYAVEEVAEEVSYDVESEMSGAEAVDSVAEVSTQNQDGSDDGGISLAEQQGIAPRRTRMIIKDGQIGLMVDDTQKALDSVGQMTASIGGYIIEQNAYTLDGYGYVTMQIGVPVSEFERAMVALRKLGTVTQDGASGTDVTDEFVDLGSRLENLEIKRERLRTFMADAKKVEDILKIEAQLSEVEEEMAIIQGRINFLKDRSSFSTISIQLDPIILTPTPTVAPNPTPEVWRPADTAIVASSQLRTTMQNTADAVIYTGIICGPWILLLLILGFGFVSVSRRFGFNLSSITRRETTAQAPLQNLNESASNPAQSETAED